MPSCRLAFVLGLILLQKLISASFQSELVFTKTINQFSQSSSFLGSGICPPPFKHPNRRALGLGIYQTKSLLCASAIAQPCTPLSLRSENMLHHWSSKSLFYPTGFRPSKIAHLLGRPWSLRNDQHPWGLHSPRDHSLWAVACCLPRQTRRVLQLYNCFHGLRTSHDSSSEGRLNSMLNKLNDCVWQSSYLKQQIHPQPMCLRHTADYLSTASRSCQNSADVLRDFCLEWVDWVWKCEVLLLLFLWQTIPSYIYKRDFLSWLSCKKAHTSKLTNTLQWLNDQILTISTVSTRLT